MRHARPSGFKHWMHKHSLYFLLIGALVCLLALLYMIGWSIYDIFLTPAVKENPTEDWTMGVEIVEPMPIDEYREWLAQRESERNN